MNDAFSLSNRTVVVTGAAGDIGRGIVQVIAAAGGRAVGWDRVASDTVEAVDVTDRSAVAAALRTLENTGDGVSGLVTAAGINGKPGLGFLDIEEEEWHRVMQVNTWGTFNVLQVWARMRKESGRGGAAVTIASIAAKVGTPHNPHYVASKGGVDALTRSAAVALAPFGIRVNAIGPGPVPTGLNTHRWATEEGRAALLRGVVLGRLGSPEDIGNAAAFLLSNASSWCTGVSLYVDGGLTVSVRSSPLS